MPANLKTVNNFSIQFSGVRQSCQIASNLAKGFGPEAAAWLCCVAVSNPTTGEALKAANELLANKKAFEAFSATPVTISVKTTTGEYANWLTEESTTVGTLLDKAEAIKTAVAAKDSAMAYVTSKEAKDIDIPRLNRGSGNSHEAKAPAFLIG